MSFYDEMQKVASDILTEFDQGGIQYVSITPGTGPKDDPGEPVTTVTTVPGVARGASFKYIQDGTAVASDLQCVIPVAIVTPDMNGFVRLDGVQYKIVQVMTIPPVGVPVAHRIIFRK